MRKVFKMKNLDCANCASKIEEAISKIEGVESATVAFMTQRLTITCDEKKLDEIIEKAEKACKKIDDEVCIIH